MKIVILDGFAANPGDLSWEGLERFGEVICYPRTAPEKLLERAADRAGPSDHGKPAAAENDRRSGNRL